MYHEFMDIVYLLKDSPEIKELNYSLRSLKNLPHDKVFFVGGFPQNINPEKVSHIPVLQTGTKYQNTTHSLKMAICNKEISDDFILMNDDFFVMTPIKDPVKELNLHRGPVEDVIEDYKKRYNGKIHPYIEGMVSTCKLLQKNGIKKPLSYELHVPMVFNKKKLAEMFSIADEENIPVLHKRTLYGNLFMSGGKQIKDVKMSLHLPEMPDSADFLSTSDTFFKKIEIIFANIFSEKSEYEL